MQLIPSACQVPAHFLLYFLEILSLFNLLFDWHREILGALITSKSPSLALPGALWRPSHVLMQGWHPRYILMVSGIFWFDFHPLSEAQGINTFRAECKKGKRKKKGKKKLKNYCKSAELEGTSRTEQSVPSKEGREHSGRHRAISPSHSQC